jgi:hypothetical protein
MGEVERAQALLQAAGVSGVKVQEQAEMVTMSRAEADALRAGAAPAAPAPPAPGVADVSALPPAVAALAAAQTAPSGLTRDDLKAMSAQQIAKLDPKDVNRALEGGS